MLVSGGVSKHEVKSCQRIPSNARADDEGEEDDKVADDGF